ncbi:cyclic nucleotide-binding domain-containing protein [Sneathiella sp. CAU 1612]|uniref:Cyclic nucleotide-binding domain-containing protein n=1 Tax=Sneathiella sedimenti TaxID=2816034 RepID=A0ABS3F341_9PROT|nr:cyclic nucleotide-binding domain-containing protein [uncultured Sneathiella sp.]MBO0332829.1 cyclic nucleotide-binding domain-containing protein [Sneathiella sedimenti]
MSLKEEVEILRQIPLFAKIEPSKIKLLAFTSERLTFQPEDFVCEQGDNGDAAYFIMAGEAEVIVETPSGPLTVATLGKNDVVGEIAILIDVPRTATIKAKTELTTLKITKDVFFRMVTEFPEMAVEMMRVLAERLVRTTDDLQKAKEMIRNGD